MGGRGICSAKSTEEVRVGGRGRALVLDFTRDSESDPELEERLLLRLLRLAAAGNGGGA